MIRAIDLFGRQPITKLEKLKVRIANKTALDMYINRAGKKYTGILDESMTLAEIESYVLRAILQATTH